MNHSFTVHDDLKLVYKRFWGRHTDEDAESALEDWGKFSDEVNNYYELNDLLAVTDYNISTKFVRNAADRVVSFRKSRSCPPKKAGCVVPLKLAYGMVRMYAALVDQSQYEIGVFYDMSGAYTWLDLSEKDIKLLSKYHKTLS